MNNKRTKLVVIIAICIALLTIFLSGCDSVRKYLAMGNGGEPRKDYIIDVDNITDTTVASIVANNCMSASVRVLTSFSKTFSNKTESAGSGFIISEDGYVITNYHCVVEEGKTFDKKNTSINIVFSDDSSISASFVEGDKNLDIAVLKINNLGRTYDYLTFGDSTKVAYGENTFTIGNPENIGLLLSNAMVSSPSVNLKPSDQNSKPSIILDGSINHGNSGGPLINNKSRVVGVVFARIESQSGSVNNVYGIGCAVPSKYVMEYLDTLKDTGVTYAFDKETPAPTNA